MVSAHSGLENEVHWKLWIIGKERMAGMDGARAFIYSGLLLAEMEGSLPSKQEAEAPDSWPNPGIQWVCTFFLWGAVVQQNG